MSIYQSNHQSYEIKHKLQIFCFDTPSHSNTLLLAILIAEKKRVWRSGFASSGELDNQQVSGDLDSLQEESWTTNRCPEIWIRFKRRAGQSIGVWRSGFASRGELDNQQVSGDLDSLSLLQSFRKTSQCRHTCPELYGEAAHRISAKFVHPRPSPCFP